MADRLVDGAALRQRWEGQCDRTYAIVAGARDRAEALGMPSLARFLQVQLGGIRLMKRLTASRRRLPGSIGVGMMHDIPTELAVEPEWAEAWQALTELTDLWQRGLGEPGWNWDVCGYPPGWSGRGLRERLRARRFRGSGGRRAGPTRR